MIDRRVTARQAFTGYISVRQIPEKSDIWMLGAMVSIRVSKTFDCGSSP